MRCLRAHTTWRRLPQPTPRTAAPDTHGDEPAFWLYSSGSTGSPKGTVHTQTSLYWTAELYGKAVLGLKESDTVFFAAKLFFAYGLELFAERGGVITGYNQMGDLYIQGPSAAPMYWNNRAKSRDTFQGNRTKSGDKYTRDPDGHYTYAGRNNDMLKVSGIYVSPFEPRNRSWTCPIAPLRARSAVTQKLRLRVGTKVSVHAAFQAEMSAQLRFLG